MVIKQIFLFICKGYDDFRGMRRYPYFPLYQTKHLIESVSERASYGYLAKVVEYLFWLFPGLESMRLEFAEAQPHIYFKVFFAKT